MEQRKNRWGLLAFVGVGLVVVALLSLASSTWATPAQDATHGTVTIPPFKTVDKPVVVVGDLAVYEIELKNPPKIPPWTWDNVVVTDTIDSRLGIYGIMSTQGTVFVDGQDVTINVGEMPSGTTNTISIYVRVESGNPGDVIENIAYIPRPGWPPLESSAEETTVGIPAYIPLVLKAYSGP